MLSLSRALRIILVLVTFASIGLCAFVGPATAAASSPRSSNPKAEIRVDKKAGTVTIMIDGKAALVVDKSGLHVKDDVTYGGTLTDDGGAYFNEDQQGKSPSPRSRKGDNHG